ncbi:GNAT family N-acetyltransferase [Streptomyces sp. WAC07061]|uniref:GNAT family N-acetyltransferase n=1 Tax=Streptomyces sp. WAC07061 TaxID=2487410 RepID=UPI000F77A0C8|nr:GNAT family N-acetyltransferase [Streptomyces sp. WAC07061]RSS48518.1 GNAT family N-acetyltransferase [Streptomyces sp. WAC07061]
MSPGTGTGTATATDPGADSGHGAGGRAPVGAHVLDNAAWASLSAAHSAFAEHPYATPPGTPRAARYDPDVAPFAALADPADPRSWADLATLVGPGGTAALSGLLTPPEGWDTIGSVEGVQLVDTSLRAEPAPEAVRLGAADVPEMLALIGLTKPGPFLPRTVELGTYLGIRHRGRLIAMAGERLHPPGWTEISAVCTHPAHRGQGLATRLVRGVAAGIRERGEIPFLHTAAANTGAVRLYESIGFTVRRRPFFMAVRAPAGRPAEHP